jgi:nucleoside-diphosphate-sugar epimerase
MIKVLLLGGSGYIGRFTARYLQSKGFAVKVYDRIGPGDGFEFISGDIRDIHKVLAAANDCQAIVILAAVVGDPACAKDPALANEVNHYAVARICEKLGDKHIIFMSTCAVYGAQDILLHENSSVSPLSVYAETKLNAEAHINAIGGTIFRLGSVYGISTENYIRMDSIVNLLVRNAVSDGSFKLFGRDQWKCIISVADVAGFIHEAILMDIRGLFNIAVQNVKLKDISDEILKQLECRVDYMDALPNDRNYRVSFEKRRFGFDYECEYPLDMEIKKLIEFFKSRQNV